MNRRSMLALLPGIVGMLGAGLLPKTLPVLNSGKVLDVLPDGTIVAVVSVPSPAEPDSLRKSLLHDRPPWDGTYEDLGDGSIAELFVTEGSEVTSEFTIPRTVPVVPASGQVTAYGTGFDNWPFVHVGPVNVRTEAERRRFTRSIADAILEVELRRGAV